MYNNQTIRKDENRKMTYEKPTVQKVEFDFKTRIAASQCVVISQDFFDFGEPECKNLS